MRNTLAMKGRAERRRWPYFAGQGALVVGAIVIFAGTALQWAFVLGRLLWGSPGALTWTLSAGFLVLGGALVRWRALSALSAAGGGAIAVFFALWQTSRILSRCFSVDCLPGPGLGLLLAGGLLALYRSARIGIRRARLG
jgi:hypothetical protein